MNLRQLEKEYDRHIQRIINRATKPPGLTHSRKLGIAYYAQAANAVLNLRSTEDILDVNPEGFEMRSAAQFGPEKMSLVKPEEKII